MWHGIASPSAWIMSWSNLSLRREGLKSTKKRLTVGGKNGEIRKSESHEENLVPLSRHWIVWGQLWRIISCMRKEGICWKFGKCPSEWFPDGANPFSAPIQLIMMKASRPSCKRVGCVGNVSGGSLEGNSTKLKLVLPSPPAPGTSGIASNGGTGRVKCLLFCSQKIGF